MDNLRSMLLVISWFWLLFSLSGCATIEYIPKQRPALTPVIRPPLTAGIYHRVEKGQTLWRISKMYNVDMDEIISANNITDATQLNTGQPLFIPRERNALNHNYLKPDSAQDFIWPAKGKVVSAYGDKTNNVPNNGITIRIYSEPVILAAGSGTVVFASDRLKGYGKTIIISHGNGLMSVYALLSQILVKPGEYIGQGIRIARCDNGLMHFEIRKGHIAQNPHYYLPR